MSLLGQFISETFDELLRIGPTGSATGGFKSDGTLFRVTDGRGTGSSMCLDLNKVVIHSPNATPSRFEISESIFVSSSTFDIDVPLVNFTGSIDVSQTGSFGFIDVGTLTIGSSSILRGTIDISGSGDISIDGTGSFGSIDTDYLTVVSQSDFSGSVFITGSTVMSGNLDVSQTASVGFLNVGGIPVQGGLWTSSLNVEDITRESDVQITGTLEMSGNIDMPDGYTVDGIDLSVFSSSVATELNDIETDSGSFDTRVDALEAGSSSFWTGSSDGRISRFSDVNITGTLFASESRFGDTLTDRHIFTGSTEMSHSLAVDGNVAITGTIDVNGDITINGNVDGVDVSEFSSSTATEINNLQETASRNVGTASAHEGRLDNIDASGSTGLGYWSGSNADISRLSDVFISGTLHISGNLNITSSATIDGVDVSEFSSSTATEINDLQGTSSRNEATASNHRPRIERLETTASDHEDRIDFLEASGTFWTSSADGSIHRSGIVVISESLYSSGSFFAQNDSFHGDTIDDRHEFTGSMFISGNVEITESATIDGVDVSEFSSSTATEINDLQGTSSRNEATSSDHETRIDALEASPGFWTESIDGRITRDSDVQITGTLQMSGNIDMPSGYTVDGIDLSVFSASVATELNDIETDSGSFDSRIDTLELLTSSLWTGSGDGSYISRLSDVQLSGSFFISGNIEITESATIDGVDVSEFSSSTATEINDLQGTSSRNVGTGSDHENRIAILEAASAASGGFWTGSGDGSYISRHTNVQITGGLFTDGNTIFGDNLSDNHEYTGSTSFTASSFDLNLDIVATMSASYAVNAATASRIEGLPEQKLIEYAQISGGWQVFDQTVTSSNQPTHSLWQISAPQSGNYRISVAAPVWINTIRTDFPSVTRWSILKDGVEISGSVRLITLDFRGHPNSSEHELHFPLNIDVIETALSGTLFQLQATTGSEIYVSSHEVIVFGSLGESMFRLEEIQATVPIGVGDLEVNGDLTVTGTGSFGFFDATASWAESASNAVTASHALTASILLGSVESSSFATTASYAQNASDFETRISNNESTLSVHDGYFTDIHASGSTGLGFWSGSGIGISRESSVEITGSTAISGAFSVVSTGYPKWDLVNGFGPVWTYSSHSQYTASATQSDMPELILYYDTQGGTLLYEQNHTYSGDFMISESVTDILRGVTQTIVYETSGSALATRRIV